MPSSQVLLHLHTISSLISCSHALPIDNSVDTSPPSCWCSSQDISLHVAQANIIHPCSQQITALHRTTADDTSNCCVALQATVCAKFGLECIVYMGAKDMERQKLNVFRMRLLGAQVRAVTSGTATLKDATSEAIRDWVTNVETTHYILGSAAGPHPYPMMVGALHCHTLHSRFSC